MATRKITIGVIGGGEADAPVLDAAYEVGKLIAGRGANLVCGGLGGVMEAASKGAAEVGGTVIGIIPSADKNDANPYVTHVIPTAMGMGRNVLVVHTADAIIAFPGSYGTLSEIALALNAGKPVIYMPGVWSLSKIGKVDSALFKEAVNPVHAVGLALDLFATR
jgi:uncharacterized protein (TIGR00725 family)